MHFKIYILYINYTCVKDETRRECDGSVTKTEDGFSLFISLHLTVFNFLYHFLNFFLAFFSKIDLSKDYFINISIS